MIALLLDGTVRCWGANEPTEAGALFGLLPLKFMPGDTIRRWDQRVCDALGVVALFGYLHILVNPSSGYLADSTRTPLLTIVVLLAVFAVGSALFWGYFKFRAARPGAASAT